MFLSAETLIKRATNESIFTNFDSDRVKHGAYELRVGDHFFRTSDKSGVVIPLKDFEQFTIPPGQLAILITEEIIKIPTDLLAFISIKAGIKFKGLVNVSGFHVDPGFDGKLKFSVYNAGSEGVVLARGQAAFTIWLAKFDRPTEFPYDGSHNHQTRISPQDVMYLQGDIASPAHLLETIKNLETSLNGKLETRKNEMDVKIEALSLKCSLISWGLRAFWILIIGMLLKLIWASSFLQFNDPLPAQQDRELPAVNTPPTGSSPSPDKVEP